MKVDQKQLADVFGVSTRTIRAWQRDGMPAEGRRTSRKYDPADCIEWRIRQRAGEAGEEGRIDAARAKVEAAKAEMDEMEAHDRRAALIPRGEARALLSEVAERIEGTLLDLPEDRLEEIAGESDLGAVRRLRDEAVRDALTELEDVFAAEREPTTEEESR